MAFNLLLENGDKLLLENGNGVFLESYVAPVNHLTPSFVAGEAAVSCTFRVNTPKFFSFAFSGDPAVVSLNPTGMFSRQPFAWLTPSFVADEIEVSMVGMNVSTPRHYFPERHMIWVHDMHRQKRIVID